MTCNQDKPYRSFLGMWRADRPAPSSGQGGSPAHAGAADVAHLAACAFCGFSNPAQGPMMQS